MQEPSRNSGEHLESKQLPVRRNSPAASTEQGMLCHAPSLASLFLSHVLTTQTATLKGEKEKCLNLSGELSPSFTGLEMIVYEYISSTLCQHFVSAPARQCKHRTEIGTFASRHK